MKNGRIFFAGNPWPEGHPIKTFVWSAERRGTDVWFGFHLKTEGYYSERDIDDDESIEYPSEWSAPGLWRNYHACTISSSFWHNGGFPACSVEEFSIYGIDGLRVHVDPLPQDLRASFESRAFHIYLLGHDSVIDHRIAFSRVAETDLFDIKWEGKIALAYAGSYNPKHHFRAEISGVKLPAISLMPGDSPGRTPIRSSDSLGFQAV